MSEIAARKTKPEKALIAAGILLASGGVLCWAGVLGFTREVGYQLIWPFVLAALALGNIRFFRLTDRREQWCFGLLGFLFTVAQAAGYRLQTAGETGIGGLLLCAGVGIGCAAAVGWLFAMLYRCLCRLRTSSEPRITAKRHPRAVFWLPFFGILLCWLPVYLAYYPGLFAYDIATQMGEILSGEWTNRNPIVQTLVVGGFYRFGLLLGWPPSGGLTLYIIAQMLVVAAAFASLLRYLSVLGSPRTLRIVTFLFFALLPVHPMLVISDTKDTLFCAALLLLAIRLHRLMSNPELIEKSRFVAAMVTAAVVACLLRNNAFMGLLICVLVGVLCFKSALRFKLCMLLVGAVAASFALSAGLQAVLNAGGSLPTELISIPSQQMSRVYMLHHEDEPEDCNEILGYLPTVEDYKPYTADPVKTFAIVNRLDRMWGFLKLWGRVGLSNPLEYLDAWLLTHQGYWFLNDTTHARIYGEGLETRQGYLLSQNKGGLGLELQSKFPALEQAYERLFSANEYQRLPILSLLFAPSLYIWLFVFGVAAAIYQKNRAAALLVGLLLGNMLPLFFGACVLIRYAYPLLVCAPLLLTTLMPPIDKEKQLA